MMLDLLYLFAMVLLSPWLVWRAVRTGRYRRDLADKLVGPSIRVQTHQPVAWFHGVSVGEIHLLVTVVKAFRQQHPHWHCVISSTTDTGLAEARSRFADCTVIAWPFDFSWAVANALNAIRPNLVVLAEAELWPNFLAAAQRRRIPVAVINARLSPRSFARWRRWPSLARLLFHRVCVIGAQTPEYAERFAALGVRNVQLTGSVKYDGAVGDRDTFKGRELRRLLNLKDNLILVAGSTHSPEESIVLAAFRELLAEFPTLRLILVPRHPDRFSEVSQLVAESGLSYVKRSAISEPLAAMPSVIVLDTIGELGAVWGLADVGYVGGTLDGVRGGQSMIEPAGYGVPTVFGPHVWNFRDAAKLLVERNGGVMVNNADELTVALRKLLANPDVRAEMGASARKLVRDQQGATDRTIAMLDTLIEAPMTHRTAA